MSSSRASEVIQHVRAALQPREDAGITDGRLLEQFITTRDEAAFATLVRRHGPMVWGVCRRVLGYSPDAEDAFQATFLVLLRRAASVVPRERVVNWLYGVAHLTARKARQTATRRGRRERQVEVIPEPAAVNRDQDLWPDLQPLLDQELSRLPDKYRAAIVLCDLQGQTRNAVARQLGVPEGTLSGWLSRGRSMLARRLTRHGLTMTGGALATVLAQCEATASVPPAVLHSTLQTSTLLATGTGTAQSISIAVHALTEGVMKAMFVHKLKALALALIVVAALGVGIDQRSRLAQAETPAAQKPHQVPQEKLKEAAAAVESARESLKQAEVDLATARARVAQKEAEYLEARLKADQAEKQPALNPLTAFLATQFQHRIPFEIGDTEKTDDGSIEIVEVLGTQPRIVVGGLYLVRGKYKLSSYARGKLYFYRSSTDPNNSGPTLDLQSTTVSKGQGEFTLMHAMAGPGYFHIQLYGEQGEKSGKVADTYFGTGDNVLRSK